MKQDYEIEYKPEFETKFEALLSDAIHIDLRIGK